MSDNIYFAAKPADQTAAIILDKANIWFNRALSSTDTWIKSRTCGWPTTELTTARPATAIK
jgi:hypothetical protein